jgi:hypothetical protein
MVTSFGWWQELNRPPEVLIDTVVETVTVEPPIGIFADTSGSALWVARIYEEIGRADGSIITEWCGTL